MIPRHSPPFGLGTLLAVLADRRSVSPQDLERAFRDELGVPEVVLLPSVRTGIYLTLKATLRDGDRIACPAYACKVLLQSMLMTGAPTQFLDTAPNEYSPSAADIAAGAGPNVAMVLAEIYGLPAISDAGAAAKLPARIRILDQAMGFPNPAVASRLAKDEAAFSSFGIGKPMYAGCGGIGCFADSDLAMKVREEQARWLEKQSWSQRVRHGLSLMARVTCHHRPIYPLARAAAAWRNPEADTVTNGSHNGMTDEFDHSGFWKEPMTAWNRKLALYALHDYRERAELRKKQAEVYYDRLQPMGVVQGVRREALPQSHFPIIVAQAERKSIRDYLSARGLDTDAPRPLPSWLDGQQLPHARQLCSTVIMLPLSERMTLDEVDRMAGMVVDCLQASRDRRSS